MASPTPPAAAPSASSSNGAPLVCNTIDHQAVEYIERLLLRHAAEALVNGGVDPKGRKAPAAIASFVGRLDDMELPRDAVDEATGKPLGFGKQVETALKAVSAASKSTWRKMFASAGSSKWETEVQAVVTLLQHKNCTVFSETERYNTAVGIVKQYDTEGAARCRESFPSPKALEAHKESTCPFRPIACQHDGCTQVCAARLLALHETHCKKRPVLCNHLGGCGAVMAAEDEDDHVRHTCLRRMVPCPFACVGCVPPGGKLHAEALADHCHGPPPTAWMHALAAATTTDTTTTTDGVDAAGAARSSTSDPPAIGTSTKTSTTSPTTTTTSSPPTQHGTETDTHTDTAHDHDVHSPTGGITVPCPPHAPLNPTDHPEAYQRPVTPRPRSDPEAELDIGEGVHHHMLLMAQTIVKQGETIEALQEALAAMQKAHAETHALLVGLQTGTVAGLVADMVVQAKHNKALDKQCKANKGASDTKASQIESRIATLEKKLGTVNNQVAVLTKAMPK
eukprot:m.35305 g.35305  ORF g.35305 m.35305 type:complete len:509 (+) comp5267_c0_seq1:319-1845(+)